jgi:hypothetical protein
MNAIEVIDAVHEAGGLLVLNGDRIKYSIPKAAAWLVAEIHRRRDEVSQLLQERALPPAMPPGVRLIKWKLRVPPIAIVEMGIVTDVNRFVAVTLVQLKSCMEGKNFLAGNWSLRELIDRLEQVGVAVEVEATQSGGQQK